METKTNMSHNKQNTNKQLLHPRAPKVQCCHVRARTRCCVIYVLHQTSPCDRFMQHNIENTGQGELNKQSAYGLRACTDVANSIPSTVSLNVVKDPSHMHLTDKNVGACVCVWHVCLCACVWHAKTNESQLIPLILTTPY